ncbi:MAG: glutathione S-transferase family protein [Alphaproteobacteria bacterium]|nr:glutathione S-transferase family protein [Alphaproteobacteria bacterium]
MIDLYVAATSNGRRAAIALDECGLPYRAHQVDFDKSKPAGLIAINPLGDIPAILDPDGPGGKPLALCQSQAILLYAAEKAGRFLPKDPATRAKAFEWLMSVATDVGPSSTVVFYLSHNVPEKTPSTITFFENRLVNFLRNLDRRLGEAEYLAGELSVADLSFYPAYFARKELIDRVGGLGNLTRWGKAMADRPGVQRAMKAAG